MTSQPPLGTEDADTYDDLAGDEDSGIVTEHVDEAPHLRLQERIAANVRTLKTSRDGDRRHGANGKGR